MRKPGLYVRKIIFTLQYMSPLVFKIVATSCMRFPMKSYISDVNFIRLLYDYMYM